MVGFAPTVMVNTLRSVEQDVRDLASALGVEPEAVEAAIREVARLTPRTLRLDASRLSWTFDAASELTS